MATSTQQLQFDLPQHNEELFHLEQFPLLDPQQALQNCGSNTMLMELLALMTSQELPADLEQIKKAYQRQDFSTVEKIAHKIKGAAVYVGTVRMKYACQYLERSWKIGKHEFMDKLYLQAIKTIEDTHSYLKNWLKKAI